MEDQSSKTFHRMRSLALVVVVIIILAVVGSLYVFGVFNQSKVSLSKGDFGQYTGKVAVGILASANETIRVQVIDTNSTSVEWLQSTTVNGQTTQSTYWVKSGSSPFHLGFTLVNSYNATRLIGGNALSTTAYVYSKPPNFTYTYYYLGQSSILPIEITVTNGAVSEDLYLTSTDVAGVSTV